MSNIIYWIARIIRINIFRLIWFMPNWSYTFANRVTQYTRLNVLYYGGKCHSEWWNGKRHPSINQAIFWLTRKTDGLDARAEPPCSPFLLPFSLLPTCSKQTEDKPNSIFCMPGHVCESVVYVYVCVARVARAKWMRIDETVHGNPIINIIFLDRNSGHGGLEIQCIQQICRTFSAYAEE